jgi:hypothetical protein
MNLNGLVARLEGREDAKRSGDPFGLGSLTYDENVVLLLQLCRMMVEAGECKGTVLASCRDDIARIEGEIRTVPFSAR